MYIVYGLEDPRDKLYHYVGITNDVYTRFAQHITGDGRNIEKNGWIWECRQENIMIVMREIERVETLQAAQDRERFYIAYFLHVGHPLQNLSVAKGLAEEKAKFERACAALQERKKRLLEQETKLSVGLNGVASILPVLPEKGRMAEEIDLNEAIAMYNTGVTSRYQLAKVFGLSENQGRKLKEAIEAQAKPVMPIIPARKKRASEFSINELAIAWNTGANSVSKLEARFNMSHSEAYKAYKRIKAQKQELAYDQAVNQSTNSGWLTNLSFLSRAAPERPSRYPRKREKRAEKRAVSLTHPGAEPVEHSYHFPRCLKFVSQPATN